MPEPRKINPHKKKTPSAAKPTDLGASAGHSGTQPTRATTIGGYSGGGSLKGKRPIEAPSAVLTIEQRAFAAVKAAPVIVRNNIPVAEERQPIDDAEIGRFFHERSVQAHAEAMAEGEKANPNYGGGGWGGDQTSVLNVLGLMEEERQAAEERRRRYAAQGTARKQLYRAAVSQFKEDAETLGKRIEVKTRPVRVVAARAYKSLRARYPSHL